ncbi:MAG: hypothetical protein HUU46_19225 [Candidatus Hydrogenedentes bacterium]|nr:hypothetical protein [Candidatus Hydrogenedentota bacterium]
MKTIEQTTAHRIYTSDDLPCIQTEDERLAKVIAWADGHPYVWQCVCGRRSKAFGKNSSVYIGWAQRSDAPSAILERARHLYELVHGEYPYASENSIFVWRAKFTLEHFGDKEFTGGFFQQHDEKYPRSCLVLDYTASTLPDVLDRFEQWMDKYHDTTRITVDGETVRTYPRKGKRSCQTVVTSCGPNTDANSSKASAPTSKVTGSPA